MTLIYLACPIDQAGKSAPSWLAVEHRRIARDLTAVGHDVYCPSLAFKGGDLGPEIQAVNSEGLRVAVGGVALVPAGVPTLGVPAEIEQLVRSHRPTLIVTDLARSVQMRDWEQRGAIVCQAGSSQVDAGLVYFQRALVEQAEDPDPSPPLVFELTDDAGTLTPHPASLLPRRGYEGDAGLDLIVSADTKIGAHSFADVPTGIRVDVPDGMFALITGRSSTLRKRGLMVSTGIIDQGWTGQLFAGVQNMTADPVEIKAGERVAQLLLLPAMAAAFTPVWGRVPVKARGTNGFGSTGS